MTDDMKPTLQGGETATPDTSAVTPAEEYLKAELAAAKAQLKNTIVFGVIAIAAVGLYLGSITARFAFELAPENAVVTTAGIVSGQIDAHREAFIEDVSTRVPEMMQQLPDYAIAQLPTFRQEFENRFKEQVEGYCKASTEKLSANLDEYIAENKNDIKAVLAASKDPDAVKALGPSIREEVLAYIQEAPAQGGESIGDQIAESLKQLKSAEQRLDRLATAKNLTPAEKKTRRAIAIIAHTINKENIQPLPVEKLKEMKEAVTEE